MTRGPDHQVLLTAQDVAELLNVPKSWVYDNHRLLSVPALKLGHHLRFPQGAVLAWLETRALDSAA